MAPSGGTGKIPSEDRPTRLRRTDDHMWEGFLPVPLSDLTPLKRHNGPTASSQSPTSVAEFDEVPPERPLVDILRTPAEIFAPPPLETVKAQADHIWEKLSSPIHFGSYHAHDDPEGLISRTNVVEDDDTGR